ncbi:MAG: hypothetical protein AAB336_09560 [Acidobacteriota bacterium]
MKKFCIFLLLLTFSFNTFAQSRGKYTNLFSEQKIKNLTRFIADDGFQGRAPGSVAGELSAKFLALQLEQLGIKPGNKGSFFQPVSLVAIKSNPATVLNVNGTNYKFGDDFVGSTGAQTDNVLIDGEMVFVGYGIDAPEQERRAAVTEVAETVRLDHRDRRARRVGVEPVVALGVDP